MEEIIRHEEKFEHGIVGKIVYDNDPQPWDGDEPGEIAYLSRSRDELGTEAVSEERMDEIAEKIRSGEYLGLPVYAYVHSGATIRCGEPFSCRWDSGQSGFVYCDPEKAREEFGFDSDEDILAALRQQVKLHDNYLTGAVFGYVVEDEDGNTLDACWGFYGYDDADGYCLDEMRSMAKYHVEQIEKRLADEAAAAAVEEAERAYWESRDTITKEGAHA